MSNNKDSQSAREAQCLESLRRSMFTKIYHDMGDMNGVCVECDGLIVDDDFRERHYLGLCSPRSFDFARFDIVTDVMNYYSDARVAK